MPTEYNKTHIQGILKKNGKNTTLHNFVLFPWRSHFKNSCIGFHQVSKRSKTIKPLGLWPRGFKCFLAFGNLMKLTLVFEIVHQQQFLFLKKSQNYTKLNALYVAIKLIKGYTTVTKRKVMRQSIPPAPRPPPG